MSYEKIIRKLTTELQIKIHTGYFLFGKDDIVLARPTLPVK